MRAKCPSRCDAHVAAPAASASSTSRASITGSSTRPDRRRGARSAAHRTPCAALAATPLTAQFKKVYRDGEPRELSRFYVVLRAFGTSLRAALFGVRAVVVASLWIVVLPYASTWFLRGFLHSGSHLITAILHVFGLAARGIGLVDGASATDEASSALRQFRRVLADVFIAANASALALSEESANATAAARNETWTDSTVALWERHREGVTRDVVSGQIMTCSLVVALVAVFMLREFVLQAVPLAMLEAPEPDADPVAPAVVPPAVLPPLDVPPFDDEDDSDNEQVPPQLGSPTQSLYGDEDEELPPLEMLPRRIAPLPRRARTASPRARPRRSRRTGYNRPARRCRAGRRSAPRTGA